MPINISRKRWLLPVVAIFALAIAKPAAAIPVLGGQLFYTGGNVTIDVLAKSAAYDSELRLYDSSLALQFANIALASQTGLSVMFAPSSYGFNVGDELVFGIRVINTGNIFFMGPAGRNPDGVAHAEVDTLSSTSFFVGFEDLYGGGDFDYNDMRFNMSGALAVAIPEPNALALLVLGLLGLMVGKRRNP